MSVLRCCATLVLFSTTLLSHPLAAQAPARNAASDRADVTRAGNDYLEAFYEGDSTKFVRSVRPEFVKAGFSWNRERSEYAISHMSWSGALNFIREVKASGRRPPATAPKKVEVIDLADQIAAIKVTAWWGFDYLLAARYDGRWMITQILWQSPPRAGGGE